MSYESFRTRDPSQQTILLDVSRAKILLYCFEAPYLDTPEALSKFDATRTTQIYTDRKSSMAMTGEYPLFWTGELGRQAEQVSS